MRASILPMFKARHTDAVGNTDDGKQKEQFGLRLWRVKGISEHFYFQSFSFGVADFS